ncbi:MAG: hypothetical protein WCT85_04275, partial [Parachlamydiales bacterium]
MKQSRYLFSIVLSVFVISNAFSEEEKTEDKTKKNISEVEEKDPKINPDECVCSLFDSLQIPKAYDLPVKITLAEKPKVSEYTEIKNNDHSIFENYYVTANFLLIKPIQQEINFPIENSLIKPKDKDSFSIQNFEWNTAFKIGIGNIIKKDYWDAFIGYTKI